MLGNRAGQLIGKHEYKQKVSLACRLLSRNMGVEARKVVRNLEGAFGQVVPEKDPLGFTLLLTPSGTCPAG